MSKTRPPIPENIKRKVRHKCGFTCIICGSMIVTYEHILPYSEREEHKLENLVLLCANHQQESTTKRLSKDKIREAARNPFSLRTGFSSVVYNIDSSVNFRVLAGGNVFDLSEKNLGVKIVSLSGDNTLTFHIDEGGYQQISLILRDHDGTDALIIERNAVILKKPMWDVSMKGNYLRVHYANRHQILKVKIENSVAMVESAFLYFPEGAVLVEKDATLTCGSLGRRISGAIKFDNIGGDYIKYIGINMEDSDFMIQSSADMSRKGSKENFMECFKLCKTAVYRYRKSKDLPLISYWT